MGHCPHTGMGPHTCPPVSPHDPAVLDLLRFPLWLHHEVQGPCPELGREPGSVDLGTEPGAGRLSLYRKVGLSQCLFGLDSRTLSMVLILGECFQFLEATPAP